MYIPRFDIPRYTYSDYKNWKEEWELIDGFPYQALPSASPVHSRVQGRLVQQGNNFLDKNEENCNCVLFVELDWKINDETVLRPDMMVVCGSPKGQYLDFPPVLVAEILSPGSMKHDRVIKFQIYQEQGVKFYMMVDPIRETVETYELINNRYEQVEKSRLLIDKNCEISFDFDALWK